MGTKLKPRNSRQEIIDKLEERKIRILLDKAQEKPKKS